MDTECESSLVATQNLGSVATGCEAYLVPTQTLASVGTDRDQGHSSMGECPTEETQTSYSYHGIGGVRAEAQCSH